MQDIRVIKSNGGVIILIGSTDIFFTKFALRLRTKNAQRREAFKLQCITISTFLPRCMECRHAVAMSILSVRPSVCLSVRPSNVRIVTKRKRNLPRFLYRTKDGWLVVQGLMSHSTQF